MTSSATRTDTPWAWHAPQSSLGPRPQAGASSVDLLEQPRRSSHRAGQSPPRQQGFHGPEETAGLNIPAIASQDGWVRDESV
jgi:hypothetical protein